MASKLLERELILVECDEELTKLVEQVNKETINTPFTIKSVTYSQLDFGSANVMQDISGADGVIVDLRHTSGQSGASQANMSSSLYHLLGYRTLVAEGASSKKADGAQASSAFYSTLVFESDPAKDQKGNGLRCVFLEKPLTETSRQKLVDRIRRFLQQLAVDERQFQRISFMFREISGKKNKEEKKTLLRNLHTYLEVLVQARSSPRQVSELLNFLLLQYRDLGENETMITLCEFVKSYTEPQLSSPTTSSAPATPPPPAQLYPLDAMCQYLHVVALNRRARHEDALVLLRKLKEAGTFKKQEDLIGMFGRIHKDLFKAAREKLKKFQGPAAERAALEKEMNYQLNQAIDSYGQGAKLDGTSYYNGINLCTMRVLANQDISTDLNQLSFALGRATEGAGGSNLVTRLAQLADYWVIATHLEVAVLAEKYDDMEMVLCRIFTLDPSKRPEDWSLKTTRDNLKMIIDHRDERARQAASHHSADPLVNNVSDQAREVVLEILGNAIEKPAPAASHSLRVLAIVAKQESKDTKEQPLANMSIARVHIERLPDNLFSVKVTKVLRPTGSPDAELAFESVIAQTQPVNTDPLSLIMTLHGESTTAFHVTLVNPHEHAALRRMLPTAVGDDGVACVKWEFYEPRIELGEGSFGKVYLGYITHTGEQVAIKEQALDIPPSRDFVKIHNENIVRIFAVEMADQRFHVVMEYMPNTLSEFLRDEGPLVDIRYKYFTWQILRGLRYLHVDLGMIHRDIKSDNVLVSASGVCKLSDFDLCVGKRAREFKLRQSVGTYLYSSPEQLNMEIELTAKSDIWAFGAMAIEMCTASRPYAEYGKNLSLPAFIIALGSQEIKPSLESVPAARQPMISRCLEFDPAQRPETVQLLEDYFHDLLDLEKQAQPNSVSTEPASTRTPFPRTVSSFLRQSTATSVWSETRSRNSSNAPPLRSDMFTASPSPTKFDRDTSGAPTVTISDVPVLTPMSTPPAAAAVAAAAPSPMTSARRAKAGEAIHFTI
eukprot:m.97580 g.97580  ORF g.97580 m.97580 type:complete len:1006 (+) comp13982_c0_seq6:96-3113(+)